MTNGIGILAHSERGNAEHVAKYLMVKLRKCIHILNFFIPPAVLLPTPVWKVTPLSGCRPTFSKGILACVVNVFLIRLIQCELNK